jgi:uroporphyrin-III C-methyltransferase
VNTQGSSSGSSTAGPNINSADASKAQSYAPRSFKGWMAAILALILLGFSGYALLRQESTPGQSAAVDSGASASSAPINSDIESLKARFGDAQKVNALLREQSLALTERLSLVEDALANMSRGMAPAASTLKLDEADYLMSLAQIRLELFNDVDHAQRAMELADSQLAGVNDPKLARIRQTIAIELDALRAVPRIDAAGISAKLTALRIQIDKLPVQIGETGSDGGRVARLLDRYLVVRREGEVMPVVGRSAWAVREGLKIEIERAQLALERRESDTYDAALQTADSLAKQALLIADLAVTRFFTELDSVRSHRINVQMPSLGAALIELRSSRGQARRIENLNSDAPADVNEKPEAAALPAGPAPAQTESPMLPEAGAIDTPEQPVPPADVETPPAAPVPPNTQP